MDKFLTIGNGGLPLVLDDFRFFLGQTTGGNHGIYQVLNNILREYGSDFIVQGVVNSGVTPNIAITEGWIMLAGELVKVDAQTSIDTSTEDSFTKVITFNSAGNKTFRNAANIDTFQQNRGVVNVLAGALKFNGDRIGDKIAQLLSLAWTDIDDFESGFLGGFVDPQIRKVNDNNIQLRGVVKKTLGITTGSNIHVFTLPTGFFPAENRFSNIISFETANNRSIVEINTSGEFRIRGDLQNLTVSGNGISLDNITVSL